MTALTGLASGLDSDALITQLLSTQQAGITRFQTQQKQITARENALKDVNTRLTNLQNAATALGSATLWKDTQTVSSSDPAKVGARLLSPTGTGAYSIEVSQLARSAQQTFAFTTPTDDSQITFQGASGDPVSIDISAGSSIQEVADRINSSSDSPVYAVAIGDGKLIFSSRDSGAANGFTVGDVPGVLTQDPSKALGGLDAAYTVNGSSTVQHSASNIVTDAVPGVELTLNSTTAAGSPMVINVSAPKANIDAATAAVKNFVDQYNSTIDFVQSKITEKKVVPPQTADDQLKGLLFGDTALSGILSQLRVGISTQFAGLGNSTSRDELAEIGISTGAATGGVSTADSLSGKLTLDTDKLTAALQTGRFDVKRLLSGDGPNEGLSQRIKSLVDPYTKSGGLIASRISSQDSDFQRIGKAITDAQTRMTSESTRLKAQFAAMETALSSAQTQQSWLTGQLANL